MIDNFTFIIIIIPLLLFSMQECEWGCVCGCLCCVWVCECVCMFEKFVCVFCIKKMWKVNLIFIIIIIPLLLFSMQECEWGCLCCVWVCECVRVWKVCLCFLRQENVKSQSNIKAKKKVRMTYKKQYWNIEMQQSTEGHYASTKIANIYMYIYILIGTKIVKKYQSEYCMTPAAE